MFYTYQLFNIDSTRIESRTTTTCISPTFSCVPDYHQCCTYGETAEEALETLSDIADEFFSEVNEVYLAEELA